ncbi:putative nuclease HARBI1 [Trichoplusia ni]|uniref:Nuclease HARBI1 n=1 Tax=Trichoplusia ni TaxID=7111 RepID=A0A7E5VIX1_TRINI|nr:putative nuclease HARBI1 [Trichoplusia ni]
MHSLRLLWAAHNENTWERRQKRTLHRRQLETIQEMPELLFMQHFRLNKKTFRKLCSDLKSHTLLKGSSEISLETKVLCALSFLATGSYQKIVGVGHYLTQRTTSRCIREVVNALNHNWMVSRWIVFPQTPQERSIIKEKFQRSHNLPGVIGCIDCTHIAIVRPAEEEHLFYNRKGFHSLNVQMICHYDLKITNVNTKFGGAAHDSHIWSASHVGSYMEGLHESGEHVWLLGDSGYPQRPWLMTPILNCEPGSQEDTYTRRHVQARSRIERCFGLLKARWRCMLRHRVLHYHPEMASKIINACCVLHNIALHASIPPPSDMPAGSLEGSEDDAVHHSTSINDNQNELIRGRAMRSRLVSRM